MRPTQRTIVLAAVALIAAAAATAATPQTSMRYAYSTFREEAGRVSVFVDGFPASLRDADAYVPIPVAVAVMKAGKSIAFEPESFTLVDAKGNAVPAAGYRELTSAYDKLTFDRSVTRMRSIVVGSYVSDLTRIDASFYPPAGAGVRIPHVELGPFTWFTDVLYFPRPPAGLGGVLTLKVAIPGGDPVEVRFAASDEELARR